MLGQRSAVAATLIALVLVGGCGSAEGGSGQLAAPPIRPVPPPAAPTVVGDPAGCPVDELRPVLESSVPTAPGVRLADVVLTHCSGGYALARLVAAPGADGHPVADDLLAFLRRTDSGWALVVASPVIYCDGLEGVPAETMGTCRAFTS